MAELSDEETLLVQTVRAFIDRGVKPTVREVEHAGAYPDEVTQELARGCTSRG